MFDRYSCIYFVGDIGNIRKNDYICVIYIIIIYGESEVEIEGI